VAVEVAPGLAGNGEVATQMTDDADRLERVCQRLGGYPLAQEAYSECIAILRDGAQRTLRPLPPVE
jgi:hypothetical protein